MITHILGAIATQVAPTPGGPGTLDLSKVFASAPWIYSLLFLLSMAAVSLALYSFFTLRLSEMMPTEFMQQLRKLLSEGRYEAALAKCHEDNHFVAPIIASGLNAYKHGPQMMLETMEAEGKRRSTSLWQRISFLNEIAFISPMLGLLGTVLGLFFAFYDTSQSAENLTSIFDGLGIAIGTTVAGLIVAIVAMALASILRFRIVNLLNTVENELITLMGNVNTEEKRTA
jgi:biopolymer transport protein ExbB